MKYYAVRRGRIPGVYMTWAECKANTDGYSGAEFKAFSNPDDAKAYVGGVIANITDEACLNVKEFSACSNDSKTDLGGMCDPDMDPDTAIAYVDGSFDVHSFRYSYGCFILCNGKTYTLNGVGTDNTPEMVNMRNVAGEITGAMTAMRWCMENGIKKVTIIHDYMGIAAWADGSWDAKKEATRCYKHFCQSMRAKGLQVVFCKVKGHSGDLGNEMADKLAKQVLGL